ALWGKSQGADGVRRMVHDGLTVHPALGGLAGDPPAKARVQVAVVQVGRFHGVAVRIDDSQFRAHGQLLPWVAGWARPPRSSAPGRLSAVAVRSEEHTSELQSRAHLVCRLPLEKIK